ncbi:exo-beta-N-acetylmuramidase NamZ family protein [Haladaptatus sp. DFWS20]|uniref:exo-beta-N-acetylmuramidase NamZ family protein n=1 Tax=Haladaptatus sp. DFWS20 TaxID=3403467 RepID=UPI003EBFA424
MVQLGVERLLDERTDAVGNDRLGLITNPSGTDSDLNTTIDLLDERDAFDLRKLFGPEHGIRGDAQAGVKVDDSIDERTGLPVKSLYGEQRQLRSEMVADVDTLVYDMQDVGCRFYTIIYTLAYALEGAADAGKRMVVLDRPNPIAPLPVTGNRIDESVSSFVGAYELPIVHGLTVGELATYFNEEFNIGATLEVVEMRDWSRSSWFSDTDLPWVYPSPNMPTPGTATLYPGMCFFEGTNLSEGRGTTKPFELVGAPWVDADEWAAELSAQNLDGVAFRPAYFSPTFSKHERENVTGVQVHVLDRDAVNPVTVGLTVLASAFTTYDRCEWVEYDDGYFVDKLAGGSYLRETITTADAASEPRDIAADIAGHWEDDLAEFADVREEYLRY